MRVILEVISGPAAGRKVRLTADQELRVGRTEWADFAVPQDNLMSGVHFAVRSEASGCSVTDLESRNGTLVNGQPVAGPTRLHAGDEIHAGETRFAVRIESEESEAFASKTLTWEPLSPSVPSGRGPATSAVPVLSGVSFQLAMPPREAHFSTEACSSGLTLCRGHAEELTPGDLAGLVGRQMPLYLIVDFRKLGLPPPADLAERVYLFSWLPPEAAAVASPWVFAAQETSEWPTLIAQGWGSDAVVCLFSQRDKRTLVEHLRDVVQVKGKRGAPSGGVLGFCWPSVMAMLLAYSQPALVQRLLAGIDAVLVELPDLPETWQVYGASTVTQLLEKAGLTPQ